MTSTLVAGERLDTPARTRPWPILLVLLAGQFMALLDVTIVNVAMPTIGTDLHASGSTLQLIVSGYTVSYAVLLITGARLGDLLGRRPMYLGGLAGFTAASLACGLAPTATVLVIARFVQGAAAAAMVPQIMTVIQTRFTGPLRAKAVSAYSAVLATGAVCGQVLGGVLVSADLAGSEWRPVFLVNVPIGIAVLALGSRMLPVDVPARSARLDLPGLALAVPAVLLIVLPLVLGHEEGWPGWVFAAMAAGALLAAGFIAVERRVASPLLDLHVLRSRGLRSGLSGIAVMMLAYGGFLFCLALHLQSGLGDTPLRAGLTFAPAGAAFGLAGLTWRRLPARVQWALPTAGTTLAALSYAGMAVLFGRGGDTGLPLVLLLIAVGLGMGLGFGALTMFSLIGVAPERAASASGLLTTALQLAQVIGVAAFGSLYLSLAEARPSAHAIGITFGALAGVLVLGVVAGQVLARSRP
ncbi:MAG TPA: MFS transporter [Mycobacteriales bacterium]|nr:MFS transporter [Mycobacteriales bacterium]